MQAKTANSESFFKKTAKTRTLSGKERRQTGGWRRNDKFLTYRK